MVQELTADMLERAMFELEIRKAATQIGINSGMYPKSIAQTIKSELEAFEIATEACRILAKMMREAEKKTADGAATPRK